MTKFRLSALFLMLLLPLMACGQSSGQETPETDSETADAAAAERPTEAQHEEPSPTARVRSVPAGAQVWATLLDSIDSETAEAGDRFSAEVKSPLTDGATVLVPSGSRLLGRLTEVRPTQGSDAAVIVVDFESVQVRGESLPIAATVTDVQVESRSELKDEGKKIGIGAAAGAVIGAVVGRDVKWTVIGAAGGAAAGTAIALGTQAEYAVLPAGSEVTLRLDEPLEVRLPSEE